MARIDRILCPFCLFTSQYIDLILNQDGEYICPNCSAEFKYEELMHLYSFTQILDIGKRENQKPFA
uniref:Uncharacterized protein n=1 Tax=candidate division WOR-3 bacterium TaxID=2052148 RepID=A0A7C4XW11_UNCW3